MKVERKDIYDFRVVLNEKDFALVKSISDCAAISIEQAFCDALETGLYEEEQEVKGK